jgi:hypothetical protein
MGHLGGRIPDRKGSLSRLSLPILGLDTNYILMDNAAAQHLNST